MAKETDVRVGDEWRDNDSRLQDDGRRFVVQEVSPAHAPYGVIGFWRYPSGKVGPVKAILRRRFKPNATGYALVSRKA